MSSSPSALPSNALAISPVTIFLWLRRAARRFDMVGDSVVFHAPDDVNTFLGQERFMGGIAPTLSRFVGSMLAKEVVFGDDGLTATSMADTYRTCADENFGQFMCPLDVEHAARAELLELDVEEHGLRTGQDVFTAMAIWLDVGEKGDADAARMARTFARTLTDVSAWSLVLGWLLIERALAAKGNGGEGSECHGMGAFARKLFEHLNSDDADSVEDALAMVKEGGVEGRWVRGNLVEVWHQMVVSAERERSKLAQQAYACLLHFHHPLPPASPFRCSHDPCYVHHIGEHAKDLWVRASTLAKQLRLELELLEAT